MKIAYLLGKLDTGGTEKLLLDVFNHTQIPDFEIIGIYRKEGQLLTEFLSTGKQFYKLKPFHRFDIFYLLKLRHLLKRHQIQIAHAQQPLDALLVYMATLGLDIKVALTLHGFGYGYSKLFYWIRRIVLKLVDLRIFVSYGQFDDFLNKYAFLKERKNKIVYNGISLEKFDKVIASNIRSEFDINDNSILMGSVGNFNSGRNQLFICQVLSELNEKIPDFHFLFVGERNPKEAWRFDKCVEFCEKNELENIHFIGLHHNVPSILKQLDAFIYHSDHDTFGIGVIEAIASGIPVFVNDWKVMLEITENGELANVYSTKEELMEMIIDFINEPNKYNTKAHASSALVNEKYTIEQHINSLLKAYSDIL